MARLSNHDINDHLAEAGAGYIWVYDERRQTWVLVPDEEAADEAPTPRRRPRAASPAIPWSRRLRWKAGVVD